MDLNYSNRTYAIDKILRLESIKRRFLSQSRRSHPIQSFFEFLKTAQDNSRNQLSVEEFKTKVNDQLLQFQINPNQFLSSRFHYLYPGIARCTDSFDENHIEKTAELIVSSLVKNDYYPDCIGIAAWTLAELKFSDPSVTLAFARALDDPIDLVRSTTAKALGDIRPSDPTIHLALTRFLAHESSDIRREASKVILNIITESSKNRVKIQERMLNMTLRYGLSQESP